MMKALSCILIISIVYWILPTILGMFIWGKKLAGHKLVLTFDDGPDPVYTPQLLDLLKKYNIKATFFVLGEKAKRNPGIILRMHQEGHLIGIHNYTHHSNWFAYPKNVKKEIGHSADVVEQITGVRPIHYRPPWGLLTLFDVFLLRDYQIVLWSLMLWDWRIKGGSEKIKRKFLHGIQKGGAVVLMHDSGETIGAEHAAPRNMISALGELLTEGKFERFRFSRMDETIQGGQNESITTQLEKENYCEIVDDMGSVRS